MGFIVWRIKAWWHYKVCRWWHEYHFVYKRERERK